MKAINLKTDYRINPLGIDNTRPYFSWICQGGVKETAYQLTARDSKGQILYDSGKQETDRMSCRYDGLPLTSRTRVMWKVTLWDENGNAEASDDAFFEMGLLSQDDWKARWIAGVDTDTAERLPADCFRTDFSLSGENHVVRARLYSSACGVYTAELNGRRLPGVLSPGCTEYDKRLYYQTYDVTSLIRSENTLIFTVADGWFKGKLGSDNTEYFFGTQLKLIAQLELTYADGSRQVIATDERWRWSNDGPVRYADLKDGEIYDSRKIPSFSQTAQPADYGTPPSAARTDGLQEHETFSPELLVSPSGAAILDFGQNLAGYVKFIVHGEPGQKIRLRLFETMDHGEFCDSNFTGFNENGTPQVRQEIDFICAGGVQHFQPDFFYSGFRYALVEGLDKVNPSDFEAVAVYSPLEFHSDFQCSNEKINQFVRNTRWSMKSNFVDIPTDCPQREKSGWTGDAQVFAKTACYFADTASFYRKWLLDVRDCQRDDGRVDDVCPKIRGIDRRDPVNGGVGWADAAVIIPWTLWKFYGNTDFILDNYQLMHGWKEYMIRAAADKTYYHLPEEHPLKAAVEPYLPEDSPYNKYVIESGVHWGEWSEPGVDGGAELIQPKPEVTSAYMHYSMGLLAEMLEAVGKTDEAAECREYSDGAKKAYTYYFVKDGNITVPRQAPMVRALALGLLDGDNQKSVAKHLNDDVIARNYTVGTGFLSTPFVLDVLARNGYVDTAYRMLENTKAPGWLAMVEAGATTIWEHYKAYDDEGHPLQLSFNHYSLGAVCSFLFGDVCGIIPDGENHFLIRPIPGGTLNFANASFASPYGMVESGWKREEDTRIRYHVSIPANVTADLILPDGNWYQLKSGIIDLIC